MNSAYTVLYGPGTKNVAEEVAKKLNASCTTPRSGEFDDGETWLQCDTPVYGADVVVVWSTAYRANDRLVELLFLLDAVSRENPKSVTVVIPYFGYARQDRQDKRGVPISARVAADMLKTQSYSQLILIDLHTPQLIGYFGRKTLHLTAKGVLSEAIKNLKLKDPVVVSPDIGGAKHGRAYARLLDCGLAIADKQRLSDKEVLTETLIGDVKDKDVIFVDDMISSGGTLANAAALCLKKGARSISACVTHGVFTEGVHKNLTPELFNHIIVSDTLDRPSQVKLEHTSIVSLGDIIAKAIVSTREGQPVENQFEG
jgi:ribose-phosphate pyrophosphokinase